ncbi:magnesium transporter [Paenibacillus rhizovicinus]|uniref:Magnesium transporter n=1 Tax=Paenibacillus rhizovicinus TaxID=2704463 RepID=A0A6C0NYI2_9BACL|nr:magnesium transporter CorA family protein [Paenibacillus rhizovicinus]QHW31268.1 magnesium transporter [Paenibacillus rhizovicinus]
MMHRLLQFPSQWEWHMLHTKRPAVSGLTRSRKAARGSAAEQNEPDVGPAVAELDIKQAYPEFAAWLQDVESSVHNQIGVSELPGGKSILQGTLMFQASDDENDIQHLHFRVTHDKLVTYQSDLRLSLRLQIDPWQEKLQRCKSAPEAFFVMLSNILETFHAGLDRFEARLGELEQSMSRHNKTGLMNVIFERRYELLHWSHLFIPIKETQDAAKEAFMNELAELEEFKRLELRLERVQGLLSHYAAEIDTLLMMDDAISNFRGNDIMKTLTIFTALFMPATVIGAVWGMNFKDIPWAGERWGFITVSSIIIVTTLLIYWWLWHKGWTGDLLNGRSRSDIVGSSRSSSRDADDELPGGGANGEDLPQPPRRSRGSRKETSISLTYKDAPAARAGTTDDDPAPLPSRSNRNHTPIE